jgi:maleamate amidohydrolase
MSSKDVDELYRAMSFAGRVGFGRNPALLVIDFQKGLTLPNMPFFGWHDDQIAETNQILEVLRDKGYPAIFTVVAYDEAEVLNDCYAFLKKIPSLKQIRVASEMAEVDDRLDVRPDEFVLVKKFQSAFIGTPLSTILTGLGVDTLIVAGCATSGCLRGTVMDACALGYRVILAQQCIGDFTEAVHEANMFDMNTKNGDAAPTAEILQLLRTLPESPRKAALSRVSISQNC